MPQPAEYDEVTLAAFRALKEGKANEGQQQMALEHILFNLCRIRHPSFAATERETNFNEGARFVGLQIAGMFDPKAPTLTTEAKAKKRAPRKPKREASE